MWPKKRESNSLLAVRFLFSSLRAILLWTLNLPAGMELSFKIIKNIFHRITFRKVIVLSILFIYSLPGVTGSSLYNDKERVKCIIHISGEHTARSAFGGVSYC